MNRVSVKSQSIGFVVLHGSAPVLLHNQHSVHPLKCDPRTYCTAFARTFLRQLRAILSRSSHFDPIVSHVPDLHDAGEEPQTLCRVPCVLWIIIDNGLVIDPGS